jgi:hypothetical protein
VYKPSIQSAPAGYRRCEIKMTSPTTGLFGYTTGMKDVSLTSFHLEKDQMITTKKQLVDDTFSNQDNVMKIHMMTSKDAMMVAVISPSIAEKNEIQLRVVNLEKATKVYKIAYPATLSQTPTSVFAFSNKDTGDNFLLVSTYEGMVTKIKYCNFGIEFDTVGAINIGHHIVDGSGDTKTQKMYYRTIDNCLWELKIENMTYTSLMGPSDNRTDMSNFVVAKDRQLTYFGYMDAILNKPMIGVLDLSNWKKYDFDIQGASCAVNNFIIDEEQKFLYFVERKLAL